MRLFYIQIFDDSYKLYAQDNALRKQIIFPARGLIYDRNGKVLINNETSYDVMVTPNKVTAFDTLLFCQLVEISIEDFRQLFNEAFQFSQYRSTVLLKGLTYEQHGRLQERLFQFKGFYLESRTSRTYPKPIAAHLLGYLGEVTPDEIENSNGYYRMSDYVGKQGLEKTYEEQLRGVKGIKNILVDVLNREQGSYMNGKFDIPAQAGKDLVTGLNIELQEYGEKLMEGRVGSIVAIDPSTGEILALVSAPTYNPNLLIGRLRNKNFASLILDSDKPLFNRAISARYPPGSTFKAIMALMALQDNIVKPNDIYTCNGGYRLSGSKMIKCHSSGSFDLHNSIVLSCNSYYCNLFRNYIEHQRKASDGVDYWVERLSDFGLGTKLGIDIPNENKGIIPSSKFYNKAYGENRWKATTIISLGIGQAEISLTPLQIANNVAIIANKGFYYPPHFVRAIDDKGKLQYIKWEKHFIPIDTNHFNRVSSAMLDVVNKGTAMWAKIPGIEVCGKTGTAQNPHGEDHSVFMAFAPRKNPRIAVSVIIENAGFGGTWAAPIAGLMMAKYIKDSIYEPTLIASERRILDAPKNVLIKKNSVLEDDKKSEKKDTKQENDILDTLIFKESTGENE